MEEKRISPWVGHLIALLIGLFVGAAVTASSQGLDKRRASLDERDASLDERSAFTYKEHARIYRLLTALKRLEARQGGPSGD